MEIIAEIANAHLGSPKRALKIAEEACIAGADAIKFQIYFADELLTHNHKRYEHFLKQSFNEKQWNSLLKKVKKFNCKVYCDIFGDKAFKIAKKNSVDGVKIHSSDLGNFFLLENLRKYKKKIFLSCGGSTIQEITDAIKFLKNRNLVLLHGFQSYPTELKDNNLSRIIFFKKIFKNFELKYGFQDHTDGGSEYSYLVPLISVGMGIDFIEKHITINRERKKTDYYSSLNPIQFKKFTNLIRECSKTIGERNPSFSKAELKYRLDVKKNWVAKKNLKKGDLINSKNFIMKRTLESKGILDLKKYYNKKLIKPILKDSILTREYINLKICISIVARSKSKRLKNKAQRKILGRTLLEHLFLRFQNSKFKKNLAFFTTTMKEDKKLLLIAKKLKVTCFTGSSLNVLDRMMNGLNKIKPDIVVRITGDDILISLTYLERALRYFCKNNFDYVDHKKLLSGAETEIFDIKVLDFIYKYCNNLNHTEYLTNYVTENKIFFHCGSAPVENKHLVNPSIKMTIDTLDEFNRVKSFIEYYYKKNKSFDYDIDDIVKYLKKKKIKVNKKKFVAKRINIDTTINYLKYAE